MSDYGRLFDQPDTINVLIEEMIKNEEDSWKAALLLCILTYEYGNVKYIVASQFLKIADRLSEILRDIDQYALACYLVELISHMNDPDLISRVFGDQGSDFPSGAFANDTQSMTFFRKFSVFAQNIIEFTHFSINEDVVKSERSICQLGDNKLIILSKVNDFTTPFQIDHDIVESVNYDGRTISICLSNLPKHAMVSSLRFADVVNVKLEISSNEGVELLLASLCYTKMSASTPIRKISVVENFISMKNQFDELGEEEDIEEGQSTEIPEMVAEQMLDSELTESQSLFHSPLENTKDTSCSAKKSTSKRPISFIVAESTRVLQTNRENVSHLLPEVSQQHIIESSESLDSLGAALEDLKEVANPPKTYAPVSKKKKTPQDIWDFMSDETAPEDNEPLFNLKPKPKLMKFDGAKVNKASSKSVASKKKNNAAKKVEDLLQSKEIKTTRPIPEIPSAQRAVLSSIEITDTFSGLTSPIIHAQVRANTREMSVQHGNEAATKISNEQREKRKSNENLDTSVKRCDDNELKNNALPGNIKNAVANKAKCHPNVATSKPVSLTQIFDMSSHPESDPIESDDKNDPDFNSLSIEDHNPMKSDLHKASSTRKAKTSTKSSTVSKVRPTRNVKSKVNVADATSEKRKGKEDVHKLKPAESTTIKNVISSAQASPLAHIPTVPQNMTALSADHLLSEAYTTTLQKQIFDSITTFSNQLVSKIQIINNEINKKVMSDLTNKYETLFSGLRDSFQTDVDEISSFIGDVRGLLNLPEEELIKYINEKKFGSGASKVTP